MKFENGRAMYDYLKNGKDLYSKQKGLYVFTYNDAGALCVYNISQEEAEELSRKARETNEYWGAFLGIGGSILENPEYDDDEHRYSEDANERALYLEPSFDFCKEMYAEEWFDTSEYPVVYTDAASIEDKVYADYEEDAVELNGNFFDFEVKLSKRELLELYAEIQLTINGDYVVRFENPVIEDRSEPHPYVRGKDVDLIPEGEYEDIYEGNYKDFLESFNDRVQETGICRIMDCDEDGDITTGILLDFVF